MLISIILSVNGDKQLTKECAESMAETINRESALYVVDGASAFLDKYLREDMRFKGRERFRFTKLIRLVPSTDAHRRNAGAIAALETAEEETEETCLIWADVKPFTEKGWLDVIYSRLEANPYKVVVSESSGIVGMSYVVAKKLLKERQEVYTDNLEIALAGKGAFMGIDYI